MKQIIFLTLIALQISFHPVTAQNNVAPFTSQTKTESERIFEVSASVSDNKVIIDWKITENESTDLFEVERSYDGKNFKMAALVFGSDKMDTGYYQFYEKISGKKISYRIKVINKNKKEVYSRIVSLPLS